VTNFRASGGAEVILAAGILLPISALIYGLGALRRGFC